MGLYQGVLESADGGAFINVRDAAGTGITSTLVSTKQGLDVNVISALSVGVTDKTTYTYGTTTFLAVGGVFQDTSPTLTAGQSGSFRLTTNRGVHTNLRTAAGVELLGTALIAGSIPVNIASDQVVPVSATALPLPTGASTSALQTTGNATLVSILAQYQSATGTITLPTLTTGSTTLLASNAARKGFAVYNSSSFTMFIAKAATASSTSFTTSVRPNQLYEDKGVGVYTGIVTMITPGVTGTPSVPVTEET